MALSCCKNIVCITLRGNMVEFYCLNCFHSYNTKDILKKHYNVCKNHDYCYVEMPKEDNKILK